MDVSERQHLLPLAATRDSARRARRFITEKLQSLGLADLVDAAQVAVSELVTNGVLHARTPLVVSVAEIRDGVRVGVRDGNAELPVPRDYGRDAITGRGLTLVAALTDSVGVEPDGDGKTVWFTLTRSRVAPTRPVRHWTVDDMVFDEFEQEFDAPGLPVALLEELPVRLWRAAQQYHDAALRELVLHVAATGDPAAGERVAAASAAQAALAGTIGRAVGGTDAESVTVRVEVSPELAAQARLLREVLDEADRLAATERLLVRPALPEVVELRDWVCAQLVAQAGGAAAVPFAHAEPPAGPDGSGVPLPTWDVAAVLEASRAVLAVDDHDRLLALSPAAAELLGWDASGLVGRRLTALIPPTLRERHVAGFTRHLAGQEDGILNVDLQRPVVRGDGSTATVGLRVERVVAAGRAVYLVWLSPRG
jgi:PAS domain S-box-containing protein